MLVTFKNTGMIEEADVRFDGLTVIAGENDTGKSTIGKLMFSIIKTFNRYERDARMYQVRNIQRLIDDHYFNFRKKHSDPDVLDAGRTFFEELKNAALELVDNAKPDKEYIETVLAGKVDGFASILRRLSGTEVGVEILPGPIARLISDRPSKEDIFEWSFLKYMLSVLNGEITNKFAEKQRYLITGKEGRNPIFEITGSNGTVKLQLKDKLYYEDATFIESPVLLNLADTIRFSKTEFDMEGDTKKRVELLEKAYTPEYMRDLILKLTDRTTKGKSSPTADRIREIIGGDFYYDPEERDFIFEKGDKTFKGFSIAAGIKYLGAINILSLAGFLTGKSLLILDEPETHVHPLWQMRFAEVLVKLAVEGNSVLLTSHSPYFIEAVKIYSDKYKMREKTAFYLGEKTGTGLTSEVVEVTHDISPIFELLAEPYEKLEALQSTDDDL